MQTLVGHTSKATAYVSDEFNTVTGLYRQRRVWLEYNPSRGYRMVTEVANPRKRDVPWHRLPRRDEPYHDLAVLVVDDAGQVYLSALETPLRKSVAEIDAWATLHAAGLQGEHDQLLLAAYRAYARMHARTKEE